MIIDEVSEVPGPRKVKRLLAQMLVSRPPCCLRCGHVLATIEERKEHRLLNQLGPNTCRKVWSKRRHDRKTQRKPGMLRDTKARTKPGRKIAAFPVANRKGWRLERWGAYADPGFQNRGPNPKSWSYRGKVEVQYAI